MAEEDEQGGDYELEEMPQDGAGPKKYKSKPPIKPEKVPHFSDGKASNLPKDKLIVSEGIIPLQNGTNKFASQKGMTGFGVPRDIIDKVLSPNLAELTEDKKGALNEVVRLQSGTNKFDSQKGMSGFGCVRDVLYKPKGTGGCDEVSEELSRMSDGIIPLQSGTNKLASQRGMRGFGMPRLTFTKEFLDACPESQGVINLQMGTNTHASQAGMTGFGMPRTQVGKYTDEARGEMPFDESSVSRQTIGSSPGANQRGMTGFGAFRNNTMMSIGRGDRASQGFVPFQSGINWADSQAGKTAFGMPRNQLSAYVDDTREALPDELARDPNMPSWSSGYRFGASQAGMTAVGMPRDVKGQFLRRLW